MSKSPAKIFQQFVSPISTREALRAASETRCLEIGRGALVQVPQVFREQFGERPAQVVADRDTFAAAGLAVLEGLKKAGIPVAAPFVFGEPGLYAEYRHIEALEALFRPQNAIPIAVGSGTINDLTKLAAHLTNRSYMCVATAASMDGYTASGASITQHGSKQTFWCPAPAAVVADLDILSAAPPEMCAWGYADLLAKVPAGADWLLADALGAEPIHEQGWAIVQGRLGEMLEHPGDVRAGKPEALGKLVEGLMLGGFAMQVAKTSRAASGAEHQFSHVWDMQHHTHNGQTPSHGFKVGIGTQAVTALYEQLLPRPLEALDLEACCAAWLDLPAALGQARTLLGKDETLMAVAIEELTAKHCDRQQLRAQLQQVREMWPELRVRLEQQLWPLATVREKLRAVGAPVEPEQIGIDCQRLRKTYWLAYITRRRFTVLDLAVRAGLLESCLDGVFGPEGAFAMPAGGAAKLEHAR